MHWGDLMNSLSEMIRELNLSTLSIPSIRITDMVDILIVSFIIYMILKWIRETRAWTLFKGILVILIISLLGYNLHFYTLTWIISKTFSVGVIALLVIFQPELRKALEQIGKGSYMGIADILRITDDSVLTEKSVDEIVSACRKMSVERTGALIAVERNVKIAPSSESVRIDAQISYQLLLNIFVSKTPLHDGAVIIRDNRIAYASSIFSVSSSDIGQELGTRHRAAVGGSEESDAYIIVVSEETGAISLAVNGVLYKNLSAGNLRKRLLKLVNTGNDRPKNSIKKLFKGYGQVEKQKKESGLND